MMQPKKLEQEKERWGRVMRGLWVDWAERQHNPKPSWLVPLEALDEQQKDADRVVGYGIACEVYAEMAGHFLAVKHLKEYALKLRWCLHGFRELFDENDQESGRLIRDFDEFINGVFNDELMV